MARVQLTGGAYQATSLIAAAQRCVNLFVEYVPAASGEPTKATHYQTPGLVLKTIVGTGPIRGMWSASNGDLYVVSGPVVYYVSPDLTTINALSTLSTATGFVSMMDNTLTLIVIDGTVPDGGSGGGIQITLATRAVAPLGPSEGGNLGADRVDYLSTFFLFNQHATPNFYVSGSLSTTFDPLDFAAKSAGSDYLVAIVVARGQLWLLGKDTSEIWTLSGASDFAFQYLQGALIEHGCEAIGSIAKADGQIFWLSRDKQGRNVILKGSGYAATRVSTNAIESILYASVTVDALGYCYQMAGHTFYVLILPTADLTLVYDESTDMWHQWATQDGFGVLHRHRSNCFAYSNDMSLVGDYQNGNIYSLERAAYTDNGVAIQRIRSFPHMIDDDRRLSYTRFVADMDVATAPTDDTMTLRFSDDRGATWGAPLHLNLGNSTGAGQTYTSLQFRRLGMARDRVFEISWTANRQVGLNGAFIDVEEAKS